MTAVTHLATVLLVAALATACSKNDAPAPGAALTNVPATESPGPVTQVPAPLPPPNVPAARGNTATDSSTTNPTGTLSKQEESEAMPMAGHGNNHSSPALEPASK